MIAWIKENLLASKIDIFLTISGAFIIYFIGSSFFTFVFTSDWTLIEVNRKILLVGLFPEQDLWRIWTIFYVSSFLISSTISFIYGFQIKTSILYIGMLIIPFVIFTTSSMLINVVLLLFFSLIFYISIYFTRANY